MKHSKNILFCCSRILDFRLVATSGILDRLIDKGCCPLLLVKQSAVDDVQKLVGRDVGVIGDQFLLLNSFRNFFCKKIGRFLKFFSYYVFGESDGFRCNSFDFLIKIFEFSKKDALTGQCQVWLLRNSAFIFSKSRFLRRLLNGLGALFFYNPDYTKFLRNNYVDEVVVCNFTGEIELQLIMGARIEGIRSKFLLVSWDRVSCKGYPLVRPDEFIVWNEAHVREAVTFLDADEGSVLALGSPFWDSVIEPLGKWDLLNTFSQGRKVTKLFFPLPSDFWFPDLCEFLPRFFQFLNQAENVDRFEVVLRMHPYFWAQDDKRTKLLELMKMKPSNCIFDSNVVGGRDGFVYLADQDFLLYKTHLWLCDAVITVAGSSLIDGILLGKKVISLDFGEFRIGGGAIPLEKFKLHHLQDIFDTGLIERAGSLEEFCKLCEDVSAGAEVSIQSDIPKIIEADKLSGSLDRIVETFLGHRK